MSYENLGTAPPQDVYQAWSQEIVELVNRALSEAWERIRVQKPNVVAAKNEDAITDLLVTELARMRRANEPAGFNSDLFSVPIRDGKNSNRSGSSIDQMPDLTIYPAHPREGVTDDRHDALFYECKVLNGRRGLNLYKKKGIERFRTGQYAWHMPHAGMIGYVFDPYPKCPVAALTVFFSKRMKKRTIGEALAASGPPTRSTVACSANTSDVAQTVHARGSGDDQIRLLHLWLR